VIMARVKPKQLPAGITYLGLWESEYKPAILAYHQVPIDVVAYIEGNKI
jgi:hypothetical protein